MELALCLGDTPRPFSFLDKTQKMVNKDIGFCMALGPHINGRSQDIEETRGSSTNPTVQLNLLPFSPVQINQTPPSKLSFPWLTKNLLSEPAGPPDSNRQEREDGPALSSSPNSTVSSIFHMDLSIYTSNHGRGNKRDLETSLSEIEREERGGSSSRASDHDDEENCLARKKLRLSKEQSAFLEESFKEHNTLNPKEKQDLAKQLNLRPRQVEVWFQNRRARTKLKQTEVDCEYLKKYCETLTEENRRLQKELQELRALKTSQPFYKQLPATTLTMCPSCERCVASTAYAASITATAAAATDNTTLCLSKPRS
ncbi:Homeobox-leucine zipper protein [Actinidia chinensis var. chinensis]|uniref:Homeobox-leucine zipper protein n=1 Tax=Actinidia chinensis var. chinensis TaxID=1590841 RepID=A0A2R6S1Z5_ACTCC|nr:Homeobox-leucine zipper protein [Actinidia chinensis var. chinensis]